MSDRSARTLGLLILSAMMLLVIPAAPRIIPNAQGASTVCQSVNNEKLYSPKLDWAIYAFYQTCGVLNSSGTWFVSTTHNVTIICAAVGSPPRQCPDNDLQINGGVIVLVGQNDTVTKYNISSRYNVSAPPLPYEQVFSKVTNQNQVVDYAQSYFQFNITDMQGLGTAGVCHTQFCVFTRAQFVGTSNAFELDWADGNNDGVVNNTDLNNVSAKYHKPDPYWDFNRNGTVDVTDIARVAIHGGRSFGIANYPGQGCASNSMQSSNATSCPPLFGYPATTKTQVPRQGWKTLCGIFPDPDMTYCNNLPG